MEGECERVWYAADVDGVVTGKRRRGRFKRRPQPHPPGAVYAWNAYERRGRTLRFPIIAGPDTDLVFETRLRRAAKTLRDGKKTMRGADRDIFGLIVYRCIELGYTQKEVARIAGVTPKTVKRGLDFAIVHNGRGPVKRKHPQQPRLGPIDRRAVWDAKRDVNTHIDKARMGVSEAIPDGWGYTAGAGDYHYIQDGGITESSLDRAKKAALDRPASTPIEKCPLSPVPISKEARTMTPDLVTAIERLAEKHPNFRLTLDFHSADDPFKVRDEEIQKALERWSEDEAA